MSQSRTKKITIGPTAHSIRFISRSCSSFSSISSGLSLSLMPSKGPGAAWSASRFFIFATAMVGSPYKPKPSSAGLQGSYAATVRSNPLCGHLIWINNLASGIEKHTRWPVLPLNEASPIIAVGMTWNDLRLILLILGVLVALYVLFLAFA
jgi:hypothetical protein